MADAKARCSNLHRDFTDIDILQRFHESLPRLLANQEGGPEHYFGVSLREFIHEFKWQTLVLFKCALLQPKVRKEQRMTGERTLLRQCSARLALITTRFSSLDLIANGYA
jgi:hypothetical protein